MFTGLVECTGRVERVRNGAGSRVLGIVPAAKDFNVQVGDSVAVNGACLTLEQREGRIFSFRAVAQTLSATTLGDLRRADTVNLERALPAAGRLDGHIVQGHVDTTGRLEKIEKTGDSYRCTVSVDPAYLRYIVRKGSIAVQGISLTVASLTSRGFTVALIPHTFEHTSLKEARTGSAVNIECDILARYVERLMTLPEEGRTKSDDPPNLLNLLQRSTY
ncbi:MAG: riboflavin synthase [Fibrobacterota bacterium]